MSWLSLVLSVSTATGMDAMDG